MPSRHAQSAVCAGGRRVSTWAPPRRSLPGGDRVASNRLSGFTSAFDDLLERNRRELDTLSKGLRLGRPSRASERAPRNAPRTARAGTPPPDRTPAERALDEKLGPGWHCEVVEQTREEGEMVLRCRISAPGRGITRTLYGTAPLSGPPARASGRVGGTAFSLGGGASPAGAGAVQAERDAERRALQSALAACARLL